MPEISFKKATIDDIGTYIELEKSMIELKMYASITDKEMVKEEIENNEVYFIEKDGIVIGKTEYHIKSDKEAYLGGLLIDPQFQGQGIGRKAIEFRLDKLKDMKRLWLVTHPHNSKIISMYLSHGFLIEAWKDNYWGDGEPRLVMAREG